MVHRPAQLVVRKQVGLSRDDDGAAVFVERPLQLVVCGGHRHSIPAARCHHLSSFWFVDVDPAMLVVVAAVVVQCE